MGRIGEPCVDERAGSARLGCPAEQLLELAGDPGHALPAAGATGAAVSIEMSATKSHPPPCHSRRSGLVFSTVTSAAVRSPASRVARSRLRLTTTPSRVAVAVGPAGGSGSDGVGHPQAVTTRPMIQADRASRRAEDGRRSGMIEGIDGGTPRAAS